VLCATEFSFSGIAKDRLDAAPFLRLNKVVQIIESPA
jgi:hypothetical protein